MSKEILKAKRNELDEWYNDGNCVGKFAGALRGTAYQGVAAHGEYQYNILTVYYTRSYFFHVFRKGLIFLETAVPSASTTRLTLQAAMQ
jgi:hypothetical protein